MCGFEGEQSGGPADAHTKAARTFGMLGRGCSLRCVAQNEERADNAVCCCLLGSRCRTSRRGS